MAVISKPHLSYSPGGPAGEGPELILLALAKTLGLKKMCCEDSYDLHHLSGLLFITVMFMTRQTPLQNSLTLEHRTIGMEVFGCELIEYILVSSGKGQTVYSQFTRRSGELWEVGLQGFN